MYVKFSTVYMLVLIVVATMIALSVWGQFDRMFYWLGQITSYSYIHLCYKLVILALSLKMNLYKAVGNHCFEYSSSSYFAWAHNLIIIK